MNDPSKIRLSRDELRVLQERNFFITKKNITAKIYHQFAALVEQANQQKVFSAIAFPEGADVTTGKISKGENYSGFPWLMLDFPRLFSNNEIMAVRTMVWWGNLISCTLLISGERLNAGRKSALRHLSLLQENDVWICSGDSPWQHHFERENFVMLKNLSRKEAAAILDRNNFLKLARKIPVKQINHIITFALDSFQLYAHLLRR